MHKITNIHPLHRGYILVLALVFLGIFFTTSSAYLSFITSSTRSARNDVANAQALAIAEAGIDEAIYRLNQDGTYTGETNTALGNGVYTITVSSVNSTTKRLTATGSVPNAANPLATKTVTMLAGIDTTTIAFHYGVQVGAGGLDMSNNAQINGNIYSDGPITGSGIITGDAISASSTGSISGVTVQGNAKAHALSNCSVGKNAYYKTLSSCSVSGTKYPGSADPSSEAMPISGAQIDEWEATAVAGGITTGPYTVNNSQTLGPQEINGNLTINGTLTMSGIIWVKGNVTFGNNATITIAPSLGNQGAILIADVPGSESTKGAINFSNNATASGNGSPGSYPMLLSTNSSSDAIEAENNMNGAILYASRGTISFSNNATANQITAYRLHLSNNATVTFLSGLQNQNFSNGAGGSWALVPRSYSITR